MENGENGFDRKLTDKMSSLELNDPSNISDNDSLFQVMKAVEAAEATIKQQVEENDRLRTELQDKIQELEKHKSYEQTRRWGKNVDETYGVHESTTSVGNPEDCINIKSLRRSSLVDQRGSPFPHNDSVLDGGGAREISTEGHSESSRLNGTMKLISSGQIPAEVPVLTQFSSPSTSSISLIRYPEAEYDSKVNSSGHGLVQMAGANNSNSFPKQVREHEQEIAQLRRYLTEFSVREAQIHNEKSVLEKRIAYMRLAFDQQQQDLVDASSKALSYRQDIMEENIRLSYQLQAAQQDRLTFVSSLLPLLAEYSLQPPAPDAHSIVSNVKVLFKHLQEQLHITESRLKDSQFQLAPWPPVETIPSHFAIQSPGHLVGGVALNNDGHELVAKANFIPNKPPPSSSSHAQMPVRMDGFTEHQAGLGGLLQRNMEHDEVGRYSPPASRNPMPRSPHRQYDNSHGDAHKPRPSEEAPKQVKFRDPVSSMDDPDAEVHPNGPESSSPWTPGTDDPSSSYSPYLQPVLEEPSSSFSEAGPDDDPLPAVDGLQISGDAIPGRELQASGYSINGTTSCNFEWVRHIADGSVKYIEGAKQPSYLVTADDVDNYLAIEVQPLDNRKRKGELVKVFANDNRKISLEPGMQGFLESAHHSGSASFRVEISTGYLDIWEPAILTIKREGYNIKSNTPNGVSVTEKFSRDTIVTIPHGHPTAFTISDPNYEDNILRSESGPEDVGNCRDTIVLILRLFIMRAGQKPAKGKRKGLFFKK